MIATSIVPLLLLPLYTITQGRSTRFPCNPCNTLILMRVGSPCMFRHPNWHSMALRRPRISTTCQVHERRRVPMRFYRSNQPWWRGIPSRIPITSHLDHQTSNSLFVASPSLTYLKPIVIAFLFSFLGIPGNKPFPPTILLWALCTVAFPFLFFRSYCKHVCSKDSMGSYKYRSKMQVIIMFRIRNNNRENTSSRTSRVNVCE